MMDIQRKDAGSFTIGKRSTCFIPQFRPGQGQKDPAWDPLQLHHFTGGKAEAEGLVQGHAWKGGRAENRI